MKDMAIVLGDKANSPRAICRSPTQESSFATLFGIVMDLDRVCARVKVKLPVDGGEVFKLWP